LYVGKKDEICGNHQSCLTFTHFDLDYILWFYHRFLLFGTEFRLRDENDNHCGASLSPKRPKY